MSPGTRRTLLLTLLALAAAAIAITVLSNVFTLEELKQRRAELLALIEARPVTFCSIFFAGFAVFATVAPGLSIFKMAAGALFGLAAGFGFALFATLTAATIGFLGARYLARTRVERRFHKRVEIINRGVEQEGVVFLLAMRLNPLVPFFLINLGMGLTRMKLWKFVVTSFFGTMPATFIYTNAGTALAMVETPGDILSVRLLGSLVLLSLMPLLGRWAAQRLRARRARVAGDGCEG
jgi:uncharacterized membrane protein YdjX (TVP38/TMEM64 family)